MRGKQRSTTYEFARKLNNSQILVMTMKEKYSYVQICILYSYDLASQENERERSG